MRQIEVFADVACPFTHVGLRRLVAERDARGRPDVVLRVRAWPLELVNGAPLDPDFVAEEIVDLRQQVAGDLFAHFDRSRFPASSLPALDLAAAAYRQGPAIGERVSLALRDALFEEGRDIADPVVLRDVAAVTGVQQHCAESRGAVLDDWGVGRARGVIGSPHFFVGDVGYFCPALDISRVNGHLRIRPDPAGFDTFVDACFGAS